MKWTYILMVSLCLIFWNPMAGQDICESFETTTCPTFPFINLCFPDWIPSSGAPSLETNSSITGGPSSAFDGNQYVQLRVRKQPFNCPNYPDAGDGIILNYNFQAGETYVISFAVAGFVEEFDVLLTNGLPAKGLATSGACQSVVEIPAIPANSLPLISETNYPGPSTWTTRTVTITPTTNYDQLWFRGSNITAPDANFESAFYLDQICVRQPCQGSTCEPKFDLTACAAEGDYGFILLECDDIVGFNWTFPPGSHAIETSRRRYSVINQASEGTYTVDITYGGGCVETQTFEIIADCCKPPVDTCLLEAPDDVKCSESRGQVNITWSPVAGAVAYNVYFTADDPRCCKGGVPFTLPASVVTGTSVNVPGFPGFANCYSVQVASVCDNGLQGALSTTYCVDPSTTCTFGGGLAGGGKRTAAPQIQDVQITPNPAHDVLLIELALETESALKISLFDQQGKQVRREQSPTLEAGVQVYKMNDLQSLADGIYILRVQTEEGIIQKKLVLQHNR